MIGDDSKAPLGKKMIFNDRGNNKISLTSFSGSLKLRSILFNFWNNFKKIIFQYESHNKKIMIFIEITKKNLIYNRKIFNDE